MLTDATQATLPMEIKTLKHASLAIRNVRSVDRVIKLVMWTNAHRVQRVTLISIELIIRAKHFALLGNTSVEL